VKSENVTWTTTVLKYKTKPKTECGESRGHTCLIKKGSLSILVIQKFQWNTNYTSFLFDGSFLFYLFVVCMLIAHTLYIKWYLRNTFAHLKLYSILNTFWCFNATKLYKNCILRYLIILTNNIDVPKRGSFISLENVYLC